jgi:Fe2+ or Zn2+ uptake regulation protein
VKAAAARRSLLDELPVTAEDAIEAKDVIETLQDAKIKRTTVYKLLTELTESGEVSALGAGKRGDPFCYWRSRQINSSATPVVADESNDAVSDIIA